jgi:DNA-binding NarL/FixJ family response regulator
MSTPRKKKTSRVGLQQTNKYSYTLDTLHLVRRPDHANQENRTSNVSSGNVAVGRRSTDRAAFELYDLWLSLSRREQDVTILVCKGLTNEQIALWLKLSVSTVKSYLQNVFFKIDVRNKTELRLKFVNFDFERLSPPYQ